MNRFLIAILCMFLMLASISFAGNDPDVKSLESCHGFAPASCHGAKESSSCHGRRSTVAQRAAARQSSRREARDERKAAKASCHGEKRASCECIDCDCN